MLGLMDMLASDSLSDPYGVELRHIPAVSLWYVENDILLACV